MSRIIRRLLGGVFATSLLLALLHPVCAQRAKTQAIPKPTTGRRINDSESRATLLEKANGLQLDGHFDAALAAYHAILASSEDSRPSDLSRVDAFTRAALLHQHLGQLTEAKVLYEQLLVEYPADLHVAAALFGLGEIARRSQNPTVAGDRYKEVQSKFPQTIQAKEAAYWLALAATDKKDSQTARRFAGWLIAELSPPKKTGSFTPREQQLLSHALYLLSQVAVAEGEWEEVSLVSSRLQETVTEGSMRTAAEFWLAEGAFRQGHDNLARERFAKLAPQIIGLAENWVPMVPLRTAQLAARRQQWTEVLEIVDDIRRDYRDFPLFYEVDYLQGRALAGKGEMTTARQAYSRVLENLTARQTETAVMAQWMIGETYFHQRDYPRARQAYMRVIDEHNFAAWQARAALQTGKCWELEGKWRNAMDLYSAALKRWPNVQPEKELKARLQWSTRQIDINPSRPLAVAERP